MSSDLADLEIIFKPNTDLAIQNYIAREIVARNAVNMDFVNKHCVFSTGPYDIGYGMRPNSKFAYDAEKDIQAKELKVKLDKNEAIAQRRTEGEEVEQKNTATADKHWMISFDDFKKGVEPYTLDFVAALAKGDADESLDSFKAKLKQLADLYIDPKRRVVVLLDHGLQPAPARHLGQRAGLRNPPAAGQDRHAGKQSVLRSPASPPPAVPRARWAPSPIACRPTWW